MKTNDFINQAITKHIEKVTARINEAATPVVESTVTEQKLPTFNTDAANYAFEQLAEAYGDIDPADWNPKVVAQKLYDKYNGKPLTKDIINHEFKVSFPKWFDRFMWKPDYQDIMYFYKKCSRTPAEFRSHPPHVVNHQWGESLDEALNNVEYTVYLFGPNGNLIGKPYTCDNRYEAINYASDMPGLGAVVVGHMLRSDTVKIIRADFNNGVSPAQVKSMKSLALSAKLRSMPMTHEKWQDPSKHVTSPTSSTFNKASKKTGSKLKENATGGGTGASSVAVVSSTLGEKGSFSQKDVNKKLGGYSNMLTSPKLVKLPKTNK